MKNKKKCFVAITGVIGSGKTTVSNILRQYGYNVFDGDYFSKKIVKEEKFVIETLENIIGEKVFIDNKINFKKISIIFDNNPKLEIKFEKWYQNFLGEKIIEKIFSLNENKLYFFDIPLLHQKGIANMFDYIWLVQSKKSNCYQRIKERNNYPKEKIKYLIKISQINRKKFQQNYTIINNNSSLEKLDILIKTELNKLENKL